jgi:diguanylate cyclase
MSSFVAIQFGLSLLAALLGAAAGWWLRGRPTFSAKTRATADGKQTAEDVLQSLQAAADTVRSCVEQHTECIRTIQSELSDTTSTEPAIITKAAESIIESSDLVQHQFNDIRNAIDERREEIRDCLATTGGLLFTFAELDRQKHMYRRVLSSLEVLAAELAGDIKGHGRRLKEITGGLENAANQTPAGLASAVTQILDATDDVQRRIAAKEERIATQAVAAHMQAILTHTDLLTSLPNRRALEAELSRAGAQAHGRTPLCTLAFIDLDGFSKVNTEYGHQGGDLVLRQVAGMIKQMVRGRDMVARFGGDTFAMLLNQITLHDALPLAERLRTLLENTQFNHGSLPLRVTASIGIAQLTPDEMRGALVARVEQALASAQQAGGNICYRHDGQQCHPVSAAFHSRHDEAMEQARSLASWWRDATLDTTGLHDAEASRAASAATPAANERDPDLSGRSLFAANLNRRLAEWKRGGANVSVALVRVDQMGELVARFGDQGHAFLRQVLGRLLEATTRDMDERCEFEDGLFALLLPGTDEANAVAVAERLLAQIRQCKLRMDSHMWGLTASIGVAHCTSADRVMDLMLSAESALNGAAKRGGNAVVVGQPVKEARVAETQ